MGVGWLEISVRDGGAETLPRLARPSRSALGGRGLGLVQHIAAKWGTEVDGQVTTVWAVLDVALDGAADSAGPVVVGADPTPALGRPETTIA